MKSLGITHWVDVRSVPQSSYWEDFRRENLAKLVPAAGFRYVYMGDTLGGVQDSPILCREPGAVDLAPLFVSESFQLGLTKLIEAMSDPRRVMCLMCGCKRPQGCHRFRLVSEALLERGIDVVHIDERDILVAHSVARLEIQPTLEFS